jgi:hypothetical protein
MNNKECNHFWEIDISTISHKKPTWICMNCGKKKKDTIPILDLDIFDKISDDKVK